jgi:hypothetical protein
MCNKKKQIKKRGAIKIPFQQLLKGDLKKFRDKTIA